MNSVHSVREKTPQRVSQLFYFSQKNTEEQNTQHSTETLSQPISQNLTANRGLTPSSSPNGEGSDHRGYPSFAVCVLMRVWSHLDAFMANHQHLTTITQHPSLAVTLCVICMPEAFCGLETVLKKGLLNL